MKIPASWIIIVILIIVLSVSFAIIKNQTTEIKRVTLNQIALIDDVKFLRLKDSALVAEIKTLKLTESEFKQYKNP